MARTTTKGVCAICEGVLAKAAMSRHVQKCMAAEQEKVKSKPRGAFYLRVQDRYLPGYWLDLLGAETATLYDLDLFLREIWLECCGHLSAFTIGNASYDGVNQGRSDSISNQLRKVLKPGLTFEHDYDFGSTTELSLQVLDRLVAPMKGEKIRLVARNVAPEFQCSGCGAAVTQLCVTCETEECFFCDACAEKHEEEGHKEWEAMFLPVVNSPRMGVCGYTG